MDEYICREAIIDDLEQEIEAGNAALDEDVWINKGLRIAIRDIKDIKSVDLTGEIETLKAQLRARDKQYNELMDYVKTSICPTCDNLCRLCPVIKNTLVQCFCCGESVPILSAHTDLEGDYICDKCEKEGAE